ncbi:MAG: agmatinase [Eubacteriales bacterium]|nr:agmatinase [Clostridiales bacterium]MDY5836550.1 agmatinase [Eubacteriales bacterium]
MELISENVRYLGADASWDDAQIVLYGAPFDGTTSFRPGTRFGPAAMREASIGLENYSPYLDKHLTDLAIYDAGDLVPPIGSVSKMINLVEDQTLRIAQAGKVPLMLGGEHSISLGAIRAMAQVYPDLRVIHFDAHTDLRPEFMEEPLSHACVIYHAWEILGDKKIASFGIRSGEAEEFAFARDHLAFHPFDLEGLKEYVAGLKVQKLPVYFTLDLDVLDPAYLPGTGTPEPGGVTYLDLQNKIYQMAGLNVVGLDIMELSPPYDESGVSTVLACKLLREILLALFA